jgi:uncharacterized membrane-anchored protein
MTVTSINGFNSLLSMYYVYRYVANCRPGRELQKCLAMVAALTAVIAAVFYHVFVSDSLCKFLVEKVFLVPPHAILCGEPPLSAVADNRSSRSVRG